MTSAATKNRGGARGRTAASNPRRAWRTETTNRQGGAPRRDNPTQIPQIEHKSTSNRLIEAQIAQIERNQQKSKGGSTRSSRTPAMPWRGKEGPRRSSRMPHPSPLMCRRRSARPPQILLHRRIEMGIWWRERERSPPSQILLLHPSCRRRERERTGAAERTEELAAADAEREGEAGVGHGDGDGSVEAGTRCGGGAPSELGVGDGGDVQRELGRATDGTREKSRRTERGAADGHRRK
nr:unnamed protein product [Digitaria exilis]